MTSIIVGTYNVDADADVAVRGTGRATIDVDDVNDESENFPILNGVSRGINNGSNKTDDNDNDNDNDTNQEEADERSERSQGSERSNSNSNNNNNNNDDEINDGQLSSSSNNSNSNNNSNNSHNNSNANNNDNNDNPPPLTSSSRLKGYFALSFFSLLAFVAAYESDGIHKLSNFPSKNMNVNININHTTRTHNHQYPYQHNLFQVFTAFPANASGRYYAMIVAGTSAVSNILILILHYIDHIISFCSYYQCAFCCGTGCSAGAGTGTGSSSHSNASLPSSSIPSIPSTSIPSSFQKFLRNIFKPGSSIECIILITSIIWWTIAVAILTSIRGPAGDGKGQFNLYFSTWLCCITSLSLLFDIWLVSANHSSLYQSIKSWPNRAPGWILIFNCTACCLICVIDLYTKYEYIIDVAPYIGNKYDLIPIWQWIWLIFVCCVSLSTAVGFSIVELFRRSSDTGTSNGNGGTGNSNGTGNSRNRTRNRYRSTTTTTNSDSTKKECESSIEGIMLAFLVIIWLPSVVIATTSNGIASDFGNTYFFTWGSSIVVIQTFITWLQDWRKDVHEASRLLHLEYEECKRNVDANMSMQGVNNRNVNGNSNVNGNTVRNNSLYAYAHAQNTNRLNVNVNANGGGNDGNNNNINNWNNFEIGDDDISFNSISCEEY